MRSKLPDPAQFVGVDVPGTDYKVAELLGSGCNAHVFVARSPSMAQEAACKVVPVANLIGADSTPPAWQEEITKANRLGSRRVVQYWHMKDGAAPDGTDCVFLLAERVRGKSLDAYLRTTKGPIDVGFIETFLGEMLDFLRELAEVGVQHGDFHAGNVLVEDRSASLTGPRHAFRVTDFGVAPATSGALLDDYDQLALMLKTLLERVDEQACSPRDKYAFSVLNDDLLDRALVERDPTRDERARNPALLFRTLQEIAPRFNARSAGVARKTLSTPFEYLSCEQIGESHGLLKELYSDRMLGLPDIEDRNNLVLTGPRGCGKTTVFRSLSLRHRYYTEDDKPDTVGYIGVYYRCDDLYFSFPRYAVPARPEAVNLPMHFLCATLLRELLDVLSLWFARHHQEALKVEAGTVAALWELLFGSPPTQPGSATFEGLGRALDRQRKRAADKQRFANDAKQQFGVYWGPEVVPRACEILLEHFPVLRDRPIVLLVDDYSSPKITRHLQQNLNRLLMYRTAACFFKVATESPASFVASDIDGKAFVEGREFKLVNLGMDFINADRDDRLRFVDDVFARRFRYTQEPYPVKTLSDLIGDEEPETAQNDVARKIRENKKPKIWGRRAMGELCSGDMNFLIELVGRMVAAAGGKDELKPQPDRPAISPDDQNKTIREEAGRFLRSLRSLPNGTPLVEVVEAFGKVAASYLRHRDSKNNGGSPPHQASRIEPYDDPLLEDRAKLIYDDLLRYSVFIEDVRGKSRRGNVVPRLYLRRFLIPFFNLTFSKRDSLELTVDEFRELLLAPAEFENKKRMRGPDAPPPPTEPPPIPSDDGQTKLF